LLRGLTTAPLFFTFLVASAAAPGDWLAQPLEPWNEVGMAIPTAFPAQAPDPRCDAQVRPPETPQDRALVDAGWRLYNAYQAGWGVVMVDATVGWDGMCRPDGFNTFVFVDGTFAGTISPESMQARTTGAGRATGLSADTIQARFIRYAATDPLCCPSLPAVDVAEQIQRTPDGPVLVPISRTVEPL
jgi:LppP/LprE lipoprotein